MPRVAKTKKKPSEKEASGDGDGFKAINSVGVGESTSLNMKRKSPTSARTKSKVAGSKKKTSNAATSTSDEPPSPESDGRKFPPEQLVALEKQKGKKLIFGTGGNLREWLSLKFLQARIPGHHLTRTAYPFVSNAMHNAFVICLLHTNYAVI